MTSIPIFPFFLRSKFCLLLPCQEAEIWPKGWKTHTTSHLKMTSDLIMSKQIKLTIEKNYMSVPFANWAGSERDWGCPSTWSFHKDIHSVPGSLAQEGRLCWLCALRLPRHPAHSGQHPGAPPCRLWSSPFFLWPGGDVINPQQQNCRLEKREKPQPPKRSADRKDTCFSSRHYLPKLLLHNYQLYNLPFNSLECKWSSPLQRCCLC